MMAEGSAEKGSKGSMLIVRDRSIFTLTSVHSSCEILKIDIKHKLHMCVSTAIHTKLRQKSKTDLDYIQAARIRTGSGQDAYRSLVAHLVLAVYPCSQAR